jgi:hypothetical protein
VSLERERRRKGFMKVEGRTRGKEKKRNRLEGKKRKRRKRGYLFNGENSRIPRSLLEFHAPLSLSRIFAQE